MLLTRGTGDVGMKALTPLTENKPLTWHGSYGNDLQHLEKDRAIHTDPEETRRRRTIKLQRENNTWGFTLQTYGIKNKVSNEMEVMTYVDYVEMHGPAGLAGMRRGDVILSVNGEDVEGVTHKNLVAKVKATKGEVLRLVVLFEDCCRKVELYERFIKLKQVLKMKLDELRTIERKENYLMEGHGSFSRMSSVRSSLKSSTSSDWDRYSMVVPNQLQTLPNRLAPPQHFLFDRPYLNSTHDSSELSLHDPGLNDSFSDDSDPFYSSSASCSDIISLPGLRKSKESASNKSVTSLLTHYDGQTKYDRPHSDGDKQSDADSSQLDSFPVGEAVEGDNSSSLPDGAADKGDNNHNSETVKPEDVVFTIDGDEESADITLSIEADVKSVEADQTSEDKLNNSTAEAEIPSEQNSSFSKRDKEFGKPENKGGVNIEHSDRKPLAVEVSGDSQTGEIVQEGNSINVAGIPESDGDKLNDSGFISPKGDACFIDEEVSSTTDSPKCTERFVNGVRVNEDDQITKL